MKKIVIIAMLFITICTLSSFAQPRIDLGIDIPFYFGIKLQGLDAFGDFSKYTFLFPEIAGHYVFKLGLINLGIGIRMFTFILETIGWPNLFVEVNLDPLILSAELGGGWYFLFGLYNNTGTGTIVLGDISAAFKFSDWFRAGIGVFTIGEADPNIQFTDAGNFPFAVYAFGKFTLDLMPKPNSSN